MSDKLRYDALLTLARLRLAMSDSPGAIDLLHLTARCAVASALVSAPAIVGAELREELELIVTPKRTMPVFALRGQGALSVHDDASRTLHASLEETLSRCCGKQGAIASWPIAESAWQLVLNNQATMLARLEPDAPTERLLAMARVCLDLLVSITPPNILEPRARIGHNAEDKEVYVVLGGPTDPVQDGGWAYDRMPFARGLMAIAEASLSPVERAEYTQKYAEYLFDRGRVTDAEALIKRALALCPSAETHNALLRYMLASPAADEVRFFAESRDWAQRYASEERLIGRVYGNQRDEARPLLVGYMCDFVETALAQHTLIPLFEAHDRSKVRVAYYSHGPDSPVGRAVTDLHRDIRGMSDDHTFDLIKADGVDILVDLNGRLRVNNRYDVLCRKPAPVQVNWYNLLASTGLRAFDFIVSDAVSLPVAKQHLYTEEIAHVRCQVAGSWRLPDEPAVAPQPCFQKGAFVFACFGAAFKMNADVLAVWVDLMRRAPDAMLYLKNISFYTREFREEIREHFVSRGIADHRLRLESGSRFHKMRALYAHVDLCLDTFPYGNGSTTVNALWQGVPTVTLTTDEWRSRTTASIMMNAGLGEFVTSTSAEYVEKALWYAQHPERLAEVRRSVRGRLRDSGYYNIEIFTRDLEAAYRHMWHSWLKRTS
jgi:protein O-GlcNAc transferase